MRPTGCSQAYSRDVDYTRSLKIFRLSTDQKPEQTKIAEILSTVDQAIEQTEALIAKQQRIKTGLMQDLLTRGIDENGNLRSEDTHEFKDSPLGRIPVEWELKIDSISPLKLLKESLPHGKDLSITRKAYYLLLVKM